jgi:hypothetical protein
MSAILLSVHIIVAILAVGPIAVAASMFPRYARDEAGRPVANVLYRTCQTYAVVGVAVVLVASILPDQRAALGGTVVTRLAMTTGIFNLLWVVVTVLMIVRPGSTTGV